MLVRHNLRYCEAVVFLWLLSWLTFTRAAVLSYVQGGREPSDTFHNALLP